MRKLLLISGCIAAVLAVAALVVFLFADVNQFRGPIQSQLERSLGRQVKLGGLGLKLFPLSIRVDDLEIAEDPAFASGKPFASAKRMFVRVALLPLLQKRLEVESASFESPLVELIKSGGKWNFVTLAGAAGEGGSGASKFSLKRLRVSDGVVTMTHLGSGRPQTQYDRIALTLNHSAADGRFSAEGSAHLQGSRREEVTFQLNGAGLEDVDGNFSLNEVSAGPVAISGQGTVRSRGNEVTVQSSLQASEPRVNAMRIESTARYDRAASKVSVSPLELRMEGLTVRGTAEVETAADPVVYRADLHSDNAPVSDLLKLAAAFGATRGATGSGSASMNVRVQGKGAVVSYTGEMSLPEASVTPSQGAKTIQVQSVHIRLNSSEPLSGQISAAKLTSDQMALSDITSVFTHAGGVSSLNDLRAHAFGGTVAGDITLVNGGANARIAVNGADVNQLLAATTRGKTISGKLSGDADVQIPPDPNAVRGLNGTVRFLLTGGKIEGVRVLHQLAKVGKLTGDTGIAAGDFTSFSRFTGTLKVDSGIARTDDLQLEFDGGSLTAVGSANLGAQSLDLAATTVLTKDVSQRVGGSKVAGLMSTVMANTKGELTIPAKVTGTFSEPRFLPDPARLLKMRAGSVGKAAETAQGVLEQLTKPKGEKKAGEPSPADKLKPFTDILKSVGKKK